MGSPEWANLGCGMPALHITLASTCRWRVIVRRRGEDGCARELCCVWEASSASAAPPGCASRPRPCSPPPLCYHASLANVWLRPADYYGRLDSAWGRGLANYLGDGAGSMAPEGDALFTSGAGHAGLQLDCTARSACLLTGCRGCRGCTCGRRIVPPARRPPAANSPVLILI